jgi:type 2 lantibiotic biosynthesis protein LanM
MGSASEQQGSFTSPEWYRALTLAERLALIHADVSQGPNARVRTGRVDRHLADRRIRRWRAQYPFDSDEVFAQRLAAAGATENEFLFLLGLPSKLLHKYVPDTPAWLLELEQAFSGSTRFAADPLPPRGISENQTAGFLRVIEPLIDTGCRQLRHGIGEIIREYPLIPFDLRTVESILLVNLVPQLRWMLSRTFVLELQVASLQGLLQGDTGEARFQSFTARLGQRDLALAFLHEYPVLARQLMLCISQWVAFNLEFLTHLCADWDVIRSTFSPDRDPGLLGELNSYAGDRHRGGRAVLIAKFSSGFQVVYKPRSLAVDIHFNGLLNWINDRGYNPRYRILRIVDFGTHGWEEFVSAQSCTSVDEIRRFYERQGGNLALLYMLEAVDFHHQNLIASGEHPVLLDLEALFHPWVGQVEADQTYQLAMNALTNSVLRTGLLPRPGLKGESELPDISGLGTVEGQLSLLGIPQWEKAGTDEMRFVRKPMPLQAARNRPSLVGASVALLDQVDHITTGFCNLYRLLVKHREELLADEGPLAAFTHDEVRVVLRPTQTYGRLLEESFHPDTLRDAVDRDHLFDRLWIAVKQLPYLTSIIPAEQEALQNGDIPRFTTRPASRNLWACSGACIENFFDETSLARVRRRVQELDENDLQRQLWFIRAALVTQTAGITKARRQTVLSTSQQTSVRGELLLKAAKAVGNRLETLAIHGKNGVTWIGLALTAKDTWSLVPSGVNLYDGVAGIALFLAYLGSITAEERYSALAQSSLKTLQHYTAHHSSLIQRIGAFEGWGGIIYTLTHLGMLWNRPELIAEAEGIVEILPDLIDQDEHLDIIGGAAGCIGSLISLYQVSPSSNTLTALLRCGDLLIARATPTAQGSGWINSISRKRPLTGFSHGAAGIAWALLELAMVTGKDSFRRASLAAIDYERSLFDPRKGNWPDLRERERPNVAAEDGGEPFTVAWCHGAPGIGLARLQMWRHLKDEEIRSEIDAAVKTTLSQGFGDNHSLCHGDLGNMELILQASEILEDPSMLVHVSPNVRRIVESIAKGDWVCGIPLGIESPGLMTGLAGIGYGMLRLAEPSRIPSVLLLESPHAFAGKATTCCAAEVARNCSY